MDQPSFRRLIFCRKGRRFSRVRDEQFLGNLEQPEVPAPQVPPVC
jgi:hypothetical protein